MSLGQLKILLDRKKNSKYSDKLVSHTLVRVMEIVGGYEALMNLPISAYLEIVKVLKERGEEEEKERQKIERMRNRM